MDSSKIPGNKIQGGFTVHLKKFLSEPKYVIISVLILVFLTASILILFEFMQASDQFKKYRDDVSSLSNTIKIMDENLMQKTSRSNGAELFLDNTNKILSTVYYGTCDTEELEEARDFTAFSLMYKDEFYVLTAGHCVEMDGERYENFKFKANNKDSFMSLRLIDYKSDYKNNMDYAIFYDPRLIRTGLYPAGTEEDHTPEYVLGNTEKNLNLIKRYADAEVGESGSPILNSRCHVVGIMIKKGGAYTPIDVVLEALDRITPLD